MATLPEALAAPLAALTAAAAVDEEAHDAAAARSDRARFTRVYEAHARGVQRFLRDLLGDDALAADATQETFARVLRQMPALRRLEPITPWVFGVARHVSLELRRSRARGERALSASAATPPTTRSPTPEVELLDREALRVVDAALARLPEERRCALLLRLDHGLAYEDVAGVMGWSLAKTKVEIFRAREVLRATYAEYSR